MDIVSQARIGRVEIKDQSKGELDVFLPVVFQLLDSETRKILNVKLRKVEPSHEFDKKVIVFAPDQVDTAINFPIFLRPEEDNLNELWFRVKIFAPRLSLEGAPRTISFEVLISFGPKIDIPFLIKTELRSTRVQIESVKRLGSTKRVFVNFIVFFFLLLLLQLWSRLINDQTHNSFSILTPHKVDVLIAAILGFFGFQTAKLIGWLQSIQSANHLYRYPELYFDKTVLVLFSTKLTTAILAIFLLLKGIFVFCFFWVPLPNNPQPGRYAFFDSRSGENVTKENIWAFDVSSIKLGCIDQGGGRERIWLGEVSFNNSESGWSFYKLFAGTLELTKLEFELEDLEGAVENKTFTLEGLYALDSPHRDGLIRLICGRSNTDERIRYRPDKRLFEASMGVRITQAKLLRELEAQVNELRNELRTGHQKEITTERLLLLREDFLNGSEGRFESREYFLKRDDMMTVYEQIEKRLRNLLVIHRLTAVFKLNAVFRLYARLGKPGVLLANDLYQFIDRYSDDNKYFLANLNLARGYWRYLFEIERSAPTKTVDRIHKVIIESLASSPDRIMAYFEECIKAECLNQRRREYFEVRRKQLVSAKGFSDFLTRAKDSLKIETDGNRKNHYRYAVETFGKISTQ